MGKKKQTGGLGKALIKDRFGSHAHKQADSYLHTSDIGDGLDWNRLNLKSVTEENTLDEFLATAELAGTEFSAEKLNVSIVDAVSHSGLLTVEEEIAVKEAQEKHRDFLTIPRRPDWNESTTAEELDHEERTDFLEWRRELAKLQDIEGIILTPFERNLDFWRQLWRVIERSDVIVQIVDARNPLLYRCEDLEMYVKEVSDSKLNVILINKADFLTDEHRKYWAAYFDGVGMKVVFWSATLETERLKALEKEADLNEDEEVGDKTSSDEMEEGSDEDISSGEEEQNIQADHMEQGDREPQDTKDTVTITHNMDCDSVDDSKELCGSESKSQSTSTDNATQSNEAGQHTDRKDKNDYHIVNGDELVDFFKSFHTGITYTEGVTTIGLVGYPNVGKSSTINAILQTKKVPVSATPGRTKHFQTLFLDPTLMLCDCPGLVMPTFVTTKAEMINSGILPIDQMRDYVPPVSLVCKLIPRDLLQSIYGILVPQPSEGEDPDRPPTAHEFLGSYAFMRGYMTHKGVPDYQRAARIILKDFVRGKLLFCNPPPGVKEEDYKPSVDSVKLAMKKQTIVDQKNVDSNESPTKGVQKNIKVQKVVYQNEVDQDFFKQKEVKSGSKGVKGVVGYTRPEGFTGHHSDLSSKGSKQSIPGKSWKKHNNYRKKEKLRRLNTHLDA